MKVVVIGITQWPVLGHVVNLELKGTGSICDIDLAQIVANIAGDPLSSRVALAANELHQRRVTTFAALAITDGLRHDSVVRSGESGCVSRLAPLLQHLAVALAATDRRIDERFSFRLDGRVVFTGQHGGVVRRWRLLIGRLAAADRENEGYL